MGSECVQCGGVLSQYNQGTLCFSCQEKKQEELIERMGDSPNYDVNDICFILGLDPEQVRRLGRNGIIPGRIPGIKKHLYLKALVDSWVRSGGKLSKPEVMIHYSELALTTLKLAEILDYYYKYHRFIIDPFISSDFPYTTHTPESPTLNEREFSNLMAHLKGEIPELASIAEYPSACKQYFASEQWGKEIPTATIAEDLILKLKLTASQGNFTGKCPDCQS